MDYLIQRTKVKKFFRTFALPHSKVAIMSKNPSRNKKGNDLYPLIFILSILLIVIGLWMWAQQKRQRQTPLPVSTTLGHIDHAELARVVNSAPEQLLHRSGYTVSYNHKWKQPNWVSYELLQSELGGGVERKSTFVTDKEVIGVAVHTRDYTRSGYDRGHMAPAADMKWSEQAMEESFLLSNICPQTPELNRGRWKELEELIREWAERDSTLLVTCGPIVSTKAKTIGKNKVKVPTRFFKAVVSPYSETPRGIAFIFENNNEQQPALYTLAITIDSAERASGIDLFYNLPDSIENKIESNISIDLWNLY